MECNLTCSVCLKHKAFGVVASQLGPVSNAYCKECLENCAEPEFLFQYWHGELGEDLGKARVQYFFTYYKDKYMSYNDWRRLKHGM